MFIKVLQGSAKFLDKFYNNAGAKAEQAITEIKTIKALSGEEFEVDIYITALKGTKKMVYKYGLYVGFSLSFMFFTTFADYSLGFYYGSGNFFHYSII